MQHSRFPPLPPRPNKCSPEPVYSPKSFLTRLSTESLDGSVSPPGPNQPQDSQRPSLSPHISRTPTPSPSSQTPLPPKPPKRTVRVILARDLEQRRERLLVLLDCWADLVCDLCFPPSIQQSSSSSSAAARRGDHGGGGGKRTCWLMRTTAISGRFV